MTQYLFDTDHILFDDFNKGINDDIIFELGKILMPFQIDWFIHMHKAYDVLIQDASLQKDKREMGFSYDEKVIDMESLLSETIKIHGNKYLDFLLTMMVYSHFYDKENMIPEDNLIFFSKRYNCYYFKPFIGSKSLDEVDKNKLDNFDYWYYECSEELDTFKTKAKKFQLLD